MITELALIFAVNVVGSIMKKWIYPKFGKFGMQVFLFVLALIGAAWYTWGDLFPSIANVVSAAISLFSLSVAFYEVILSKFDIFKGTSPELVEARTKANS